MDSLALVYGVTFWGKFKKKDVISFQLDNLYSYSFPRKVSGQYKPFITLILFWAADLKKMTKWEKKGSALWAKLNSA